MSEGMAGLIFTALQPLLAPAAAAAFALAVLLLIYANFRDFT